MNSFLLCQDQKPVPFRYAVTPHVKVNCFEPKQLPSDSNWADLRASMFGAAYRDFGFARVLKFFDLPDTVGGCLTLTRCFANGTRLVFVDAFQNSQRYQVSSHVMSGSP